MAKKTPKQLLQEYREAISEDDQELIKLLISKDDELTRLLEQMYGDVIHCAFNNIRSFMTPEEVKETFTYFKAQKDLLEQLLNLNPE